MTRSNRRTAGAVPTSMKVREMSFFFFFFFFCVFFFFLLFLFFFILGVHLIYLWANRLTADKQRFLRVLSVMREACRSESPFNEAGDPRWWPATGRATRTWRARSDRGSVSSEGARRHDGTMTGCLRATSRRFVAFEHGLKGRMIVPKRRVLPRIAKRMGRKWAQGIQPSGSGSVAWRPAMRHAWPADGMRFRPDSGRPLGGSAEQHLGPADLGWEDALAGLRPGGCDAHDVIAAAKRIYRAIAPMRRDFRDRRADADVACRH